MDNFANREKIEKYLTELSDEYKTLLFHALVDQSGSIESLNISDLLRLDNTAKKHLRSDYRKYAKQRRILFAGGLGYMLCGVFLFMCYEISTLKYSDDYVIVVLSLVIGFLGLILCILSLALPTTVISRKHKTKNDETMSLLKYEVIAKWRDVEGLVNDLAVDEGVKSPQSAITYLFESDLVSKQDYVVLRTLLKLRNEAVHSCEFNHTHDDVRNILKDAEKVLTKLNKTLG